MAQHERRGERNVNMLADKLLKMAEAGLAEEHTSDDIFERWQQYFMRLSSPSADRRKTGKRRVSFRVRFPRPFRAPARIYPFQGTFSGRGGVLFDLRLGSRLSGQTELNHFVKNMKSPRFVSTERLFICGFG